MKITNTINLTNEEVAITNQILEFDYPYQMIRQIRGAKTILDLMPIGQPMKCMEVAILTESIEGIFGDLTCQKVSALLKTLVKAGLVKRIEETVGTLEVENFLGEKKTVPHIIAHFVRIA